MNQHQHQHQHHQALPPRKILPLSKRPKFTDEGVRDIHGVPTHRCRVSRGLQQDSPESKNKPSEKQPTLNLTPCHICHRRPTKKSDLDSFAECQGCNLRTCYVCIRQCQGRSAGDDSASILSEQEALSRSFIMEDVDDNTASAADPRDLDGSSPHAHGTAALKDISTGWLTSGHKSVVCSRCCVEKGAQGEVVCLGCLSG